MKRAAANFCFPAAVLFAINLAFLYLDRMDYDLLTEDYIETTDYWTSKVHRFGYGDVDRVEVTCAFEKDGDLELSYRLELGDNRSIKAISLDTPKAFRTVLPDRLAAWTKVDARLRAAGVQVVHEVRKVKGKRRSRLNDEDCAAGLDNLIGREVREKVMPLLREAGARSPTP